MTTQMKTSPIFLIGILSACILLCSGVSNAEEVYDPFTLAIGVEDLDLEACALWHDGELQSLDEEKFKQALGLVPITSQTEHWNRSWSAGRVGLDASRYGRGNPQTEVFHYRICFSRPQTIGSVLCSNQKLYILREDAPYPGDPAVPEHWQEMPIPPLQRGINISPFPVGTTTRAILLTDKLKSGVSQAWPVRLLKHRLINVASTAAVTASSEYEAPRAFGEKTYRAADVIRGRGPWYSNGKGDDGRVHGSFISDVEPAWFTLAWDNPQRLVGTFSLDNFDILGLRSFRADATGSPLLGTRRDWQSVAMPAQDGQVLQVRSDHGRWCRFLAPVQTRGLRLEIKKAWTTKNNQFTTMTQVAELKVLMVLVDLGQAPIPEITDGVETAPPFRIPYELGDAGTLTMVVEDTDGRRIRNLTARCWREAGEHDEPWDLKNDAGELVKPGPYRWRAITGPELRLSYEQTVYPNVSDLFPENTPWLNARAGAGGWLADHSPPFGVCAGGDYTFFTAPTPESGVGFAVCDLSGRKLWGIPGFAAWTGGNRVASDGSKVYVESYGWYGDDAGADRVWEVDIESHQVKRVFSAKSDERRARGCKGLAMRDGKVYLSINAPQKWLANAVGVAAVDTEHCQPRYASPRKPRVPYEIVPNPADDFLRLFRLKGTPPGYSTTHGLTYLESPLGPGRKQHVVLAFINPVAIGSCIYPVPQGMDYQVKLSVLRPTAPFPPDPENEKQWIPFEVQGKLPWDIAIAPADTLTRALRISFIRGEDDELADILDMPDDDDGGLFGAAGDNDSDWGQTGAWSGQLEGIQLLRRRYRNLFGSATVEVSSGSIDNQGIWVAQRNTPLSSTDPEIYLMRWETEQEIRGLAIKEIDCSLAEIDVWTGPEGEPVSLSDVRHWKMVGKYVPRRRMNHGGFAGHNADARYMDGVVDFGETMSTRAVRLRIVEQWTTSTHEGSCAKDGFGLDPSRCRLFGVAPLQYLGGEVPVDSLASERLEVLDPATGKIEREVAINQPGDLDFDASGNLYALSAGQLVRVDLEAGKHTVLASDLTSPTAIAVDSQNQLYVFDTAPDRKVIRVYSADGQYLRDIGTPGGYQPGPWNPMRFENLSSLAVDKQDKLWVVDSSYWPKRVACFRADGTHIRDILGPTAYGGGGVLDPYDKSRMVYGPLEFELDWDTGKSRLKNLLTTGSWMGLSGEVHLPVGGRDYFVTRPQGPAFTRPVGVVYLYENDHLRPVAAVGFADQFGPLAQPAIVDSLGDRLLPSQEFIWTDLDGDGKVSVEEVVFAEREISPLTLFNDDLGVQAGHYRFVVERFLDNGAPVYQRVRTPKDGDRDFACGPVFRFDDGTYYQLGNGYPDTGFTADGGTTWTYPNEGTGVGPDRSAKPFSTDQVLCQFAMVGHETATGGDLGEFFVVNANMGSWYVWTADGLLATRIFRDLRDADRIPWTMEEHDRGLDLSDVTAGQEHFSGWFCRSREDNRYYAVAGHHWAGVVDVAGLDQFKRFGGALEVTPADVKATMEWERAQARVGARDRLKLYNCYPVANSPMRGQSLIDRDGIEKLALDDRTTFAMAYDDTNLYLAYRILQGKDLVNTGEQWDQLFKTGGCVDLMLGSDPAAAPSRRAPVQGDMRLLFSRVQDTPIAVLYDAVKPGTAADQHWTIASPVTSVQFDEVKRLDHAVLRYTRHIVANSDALTGFTLAVAIPLADVGLTVTPDLTLKMDWGYLESDARGTQVLARRYWANPATSTLADAPSEARLQPDLWGWVRFHKTSPATGPSLTPSMLTGKTKELSEDEVLDLLEE